MRKLYTEKEAREAIVDIGRRVYQAGLVGANDGNISCRIDDGAIIVTPTGVSKGFMKEEELVKMTVQGDVIGPGKPSSEVKMHLKAYQDNEEINGVVHVHPPVATACSVIGLDLDHPFVAEGVLFVGNIMIARYAKPGTYAVPDSIAPYLKTHNGALLERHGAITWGPDPYSALFRMEAMEHQAKIMMYSMLLSKLSGKEIHHFSREELDDLVAIRDSLGSPTGGTPLA